MSNKEKRSWKGSSKLKEVLRTKFLEGTKKVLGKDWHFLERITALQVYPKDVDNRDDFRKALFGVLQKVGSL